MLPRVVSILLIFVALAGAAEVVPKGVVTRHVLAPGKIYPGTPHTYSLYVPSQYVAAKPTPFMIFLDGGGFAGNNWRVPIVFDNLIAKHEIPPMLGIFIDPGVLPSLSDQAQNRFNRIFEYDSIGDRYARFLSEEVIPEIAKSYNLSKDPNDRGIAGSSTGGVGAFVAAWNRPDQFRRVITFIGTYVAMKGADSIPAMIRKTEPKPIRIFMQDGRNDHVLPDQPWGTFYAGSWPINNQVMYEAFEFAGYDVKFALGDGGHDGKQGSAILPDVLRWLWREYPKPIEVREPAAMSQPGWDPRGKAFSIVSAAKGWEPIGGHYSALPGVAPDKQGNVYFADPASHRIYQCDPDGKVTVFKENSGGAAALRVGADGRLYAAQPARKRIVSFGANGDERIVAQNVVASDLALTAKGDIYFTDSANASIGRVDAAGHARIVYKGDDLIQPSGLSLSPDQAMLIVTDSAARFSWTFQIASDGGLVNGEPFYRLEMPEGAWKSGTGGVTVDSIGQVYFATPVGIQVCEDNGRVATILNSPGLETLTQVIFAGRELNWIYATAGGKLFRRPVKVTGVAAWTPVKPPKPPL
jgi:enterochelin esterase-like enzyme/sugar lactone lactonase YvrE